MKHFFSVLLAITIGLQPLAAQLAEPVYRVNAELDPKRRLVKGEVDITVPAGMQEIKLHAWANGFRSKNTEFAKILLERYTNYFYFYEDDELGGYARLEITCNGKKINIEPTAEILSFEAPANGGQENKIHVDFTLKLPKHIFGFGAQGRRIFLEHWYPTLAYHDGKRWFTSENRPDVLLPEAVGQHHITLKHPNDYIVLHEYKDFVDVQMPDFKLSVHGKTPSLAVVPARYSHSFFPEKPVETIFTVISRDSLDDGKMSKYQHKLSQTLHFWQRHFPFSPRNRFVMKPVDKPIKFARYYFFHNALWSMLKQHYVIPEHGYAFIKTINQFYLEKLKSALKDDRSFSDEVEEDLALKYYPDDFIRKMDFSNYPNLFFEHSDPVFFTVCCGKQVGLHLFQQLEDYLGADSFVKGLDQYLGDHFHKEISFDGLVHYLSSREEKDLVPFLQNSQSSDRRSDYYIKKAFMAKDSVRLTVVNRGEVGPPLKIRAQGGKEKKDYWFTGFPDSLSVAFHVLGLNSPLEKLTLDPDRLLREKTSSDQVVTIHAKADQYFSKIKNQPYLKKDVSLNPVIGYNYADKFMAGARFTMNNPDLVRGFYTTLMPFYSFKGKNVVGQGRVGYNWFRKAGFSRMQAEILGKSYHRFYQDSLKYRERYIKLQPSLNIRFGEWEDKLNSNLSVRGIFLWEEEALFPGGTFSGKEYKPSTIWHVEYKLNKSSELGDTRLRWMFENQQYTPAFSDQRASYGKMSVILDKDFFYRTDKVISLRFFGAAFLWNSRRDSPSYDPAFTRGSIALAHQGFNDYLYDEDYVVRQNQDVFIGQVSASEGGGFKLAPGPAYNIGMTNRHAAALNLEADLPFRKIDFITLFFDAGFYGDLNNENQVLYAGGVSVHINDFLSIHYPLILSPAWENIYGTKLFSFEKLTFSLNIRDLIN